MSLMTAEKVQTIIEAALMIAGRPMPVVALQNLFHKDEQPTKDEVKEALAKIEERHQDSGIELKQVASGYRLQAKAELSEWLGKLYEERPARYSRAFLETLSIIAYKQPITRAEIEEIRGVTVSTNIMKTLQEREWIRLVGFKDTPGKPAIYGTTKAFLDEFNLEKLSDLPTLAEFKDIKAQDSDVQVQLAIENSGVGPDNSEVIPEEREALIDDTAAETEDEITAEDNLAASEAAAEDTVSESAEHADDHIAASEDTPAEHAEVTADEHLAANEAVAETASKETTMQSSEAPVEEEMDVDEADLALA